MAAQVSPFLYPGAAAKADTLAIVYLKRDHQIPAILRTRDDQDEGYSEGKVLNTRFGSFPHNTLIGLPWGSQVRASKVDTGSRGRRKDKVGEKRKREDGDTDTPEAGLKQAETASSGFVHLLPPTPENWTTSLPHRTQVVYTPDYSYILHRIRARPGSHIIEAGAGSGSFTHASSRAVYNGYPPSTPAKRQAGKVYSYEFHEQRHQKLTQEIHDHGLDGIVQITHRDVCADGFLVGDNTDQSPGADCVFLDLPAPWLALPHLSRQPKASFIPNSEGTAKVEKSFISPLNPDAPVQICTFSPCIEQVQRTISAMRKLGWVSIQMVEIANKRLEVRRERIGISHPEVRGAVTSPATIEEAMIRLREVEGRFKSFHTGNEDDEEMKQLKEKEKEDKNHKKDMPNPNNKKALIESLVARKAFKEGRLAHRSEPELKTHTSYLVFAVLPVEWSAEDEAIAREKWKVRPHREEKPVSKKQAKRDAREREKGVEQKPGANGVVKEEFEVEPTDDVMQDVAAAYGASTE
jgi:tRNA (adenine57-N1/adenine58-N1)-methyltransferase